MIWVETIFLFYYFVFWLIIVFCSGCICCKEKLHWWGVKIILACGYKEKQLDCCQGLCWFSKVVVVTSLISTTSLTLNTWLSFQYHALFSFSFVGLKSNLRVIDYYWGVYATTELLVTMPCLSVKKSNLRAIGYYYGMFTTT